MCAICRESIGHHVQDSQIDLFCGAYQRLLCICSKRRDEVTDWSQGWFYVVKPSVPLIWSLRFAVLMQHKPSECKQKAKAGDTVAVHYSVSVLVTT